MLELFLGGARSGKSRLAEQRARGQGGELLYIATATAGDEEMAARIAHHRARRGEGWRTLEEPLQLAAAIGQHAGEERCILVDCLTLWLSNWLLSGDEAAWQGEREALFDAISRAPGHIVLVSNEVGQGVVPADALSRRFVDEAGRLHQELAAQCDRVVLVVAGLPQVLKGVQ